MLSVEECRKINPELELLSDKELASLRDALCVIVENVVDEYLEKEINGEPSK